MLNQLIAQYAADSLQPLSGPVISRLAGLTKVLETTAFTKNKSSKSPIPVQASPSDCAASGKSFPDLVPDSKERLIVYFEDGSALANGRKWTSRMRLIVWGNADLFANVEPELVPVLLIAQMSKLLEQTSSDVTSPVRNLQCTVLGCPASDVNLFSKYTYSETRSQYLLAPYFAFGLDLQFSYTLQHDCFNDLIGINPDRC